MIVVVPVVLTASKIRSEEKRGRIEVIFARSVSRYSMFGSYILIATLGSIFFMLASALGLYGAAAIAAPGILDMGEVVRSALLLVPAILVVMGLSVFLVGLLPKLSGLVWVLFGYSFMTVYFGPLMNLPEWMAKLSPFGHVPELAAQNISILPNVKNVVVVGRCRFGK